MSDVKEKSWSEFRQSGFLFMVNLILHTFGWAIVFEFKDGEVSRVYPARVPFRGFDEKSNTEGYEKLTRYMAKESKELLKDFDQL